jgi:hypothetical protein
VRSGAPDADLSGCWSVAAIERAVPHIVHLERHIRGDEEQFDTLGVKKRHEFACAAVSEGLHPAKEDAGVLTGDYEATTTVMNANPSGRIGAVRCPRSRPDLRCIQTHEIYSAR